MVSIVGPRNHLTLWTLSSKWYQFARLITKTTLSCLKLIIVFTVTWHETRVAVSNFWNIFSTTFSTFAGIFTICTVHKVANNISEISYLNIWFIAIDLINLKPLEKISTIRTNNKTSYMRPILQQYTPIRLPGSSAKVKYTSKEPTVFTAPYFIANSFQ